MFRPLLPTLDDPEQGAAHTWRTVRVVEATDSVAGSNYWDANVPSLSATASPSGSSSACEPVSPAHPLWQPQCGRIPSSAPR